MNEDTARAELTYIADLLMELWGNQTDRLFELARYFADELKERTT